MRKLRCKGGIPCERCSGTLKECKVMKIEKGEKDREAD